MPADPRSVDPTECLIRHVRRGVAGQSSAQTIARGVFVRADDVDGEDGLNGIGGWKDAEVTVALSDDGTFRLTLPNAAGPDGRLHRRRFAILTSDAAKPYEPGEEWLEFWREGGTPNDLLLVGTPTAYNVGRAEVTLTGVDVAGALSGFRTTEVDVWDAHAPVDVARHYLRAPVLLVGATPGTSYTRDTTGFSDVNVARSDAIPADVATDCWTAEARWRVTQAAPPASAALALNIAGYSLQYNAVDGTAYLVNVAAAGEVEQGKKVGARAPGEVVLRIVAFYDRLFAFVNGELVVEQRRYTYPVPAKADHYVYNTTATLDAVEVTSLAPYAARGASAAVDLRVPGTPPPGGLRARYWNAASVYARFPGSNAGRNTRLFRLTAGDPLVERLDPTIAFTGVFNAGLPGAYAARWEGSIYLDLATSDRQLNITMGAVNLRLFIGRTRRNLDEAATTWSTPPADKTIASLRTLLGTSQAGWYPIVLEATGDGSASSATIGLRDSPVGQAVATVPAARLSPLGTYSEHVRHENHRDVFGSVLAAFGYQWRVIPRQLESGEFPGQVAIGLRVGTDLDVVIADDDVGADVAVEGKADDVVDGMLADAAGIADPRGSGQLTARVIDYTRALAKSTLRLGYESLSEITETALLRARIASLLALRSSPNEVVGARPRGQRDLVDTFPITGNMTRHDWRPGDGVRLRLDVVDVVDQSSRQLTRIAWSLKPDGIGHPVVGFRQRPRTVKAALNRLLRIALGAQRNYQGTLAIITGEMVASTGTLPGNGATTYSRCGMPANPDDVVSATLVVTYKDTTTAQAVYVYSAAATDVTTSVVVTTVGRYDLTPWVTGRDGLGSGMGGAAMLAKMQNVAGTYAEFYLELLVRV